MNEDRLPPYSLEAEQGVLGCCLINTAKTAVALKAGVTIAWFYDIRHIEIFKVLSAMSGNGGGDIVVAGLKLRDKGKLEAAGGVGYLAELQDKVPSAENLPYYLPELADYFRRRQIVHAATRLRMLAEDRQVDSAGLFNDTRWLLEHFLGQTDALPPIITAGELVASDIALPLEIISGVLHQGSKLILGGSSKSYKTWALIDMALSVATGTPWLGFQTRPGKVLYVNLEIQAAFFRRRLMEVAQAKGLDIKEQPQIWNLRGHPADYRVLLPKIRNRIREDNYALVIIDPTYKLLGIADENSATDITALLNMVENLAVTTGAAVALAGHFAKGNPSAKETIDRISGSGVFARDPDSLAIFTRHEEEGAFTTEWVVRNLAPVPPFVVQWQYPLFVREEGLDPSRLKQAGGRPATHKPETLLDCLGEARLATSDWKRIASEEHGISRTRFFELLKGLHEEGKVLKSAVDGKWEKVGPGKRNWTDENDPL